MDTDYIHLKAKLSGYRWVVLAIAWTAFLTVYLTRLSIGPLAPFLKDAFALSNAQVGLMVSASAVIYGPALLVAGWLVDRVGVRRLLIAGTVIMSMCLFGLSFAPSYRFMIVILIFSGLGAGCMYPSVVKAIVIWFPSRERATVLGINQTAVNAGGIIGAAILPAIAITLGWRYGLFFIGIGAVAICLCCAILYRDPVQEAVPSSPKREPQGASDKTSTKHLMIKLLMSRDIWMLGLAALFLALVEFAAMTHLVVYLKENLLFGAVQAGALLAMTEAAGAFGKPASGLVSDRLLCGNRKKVLMGMGLLAVVSSLAIAIGGAKIGWLIYPVLAVLGLAAIGWGGLSATIAGEMGGVKLAGLATGASSSLMIVGSFSGPLLFGYVVDKTGSFQIAWFLMAFCAAASVLFASLLREKNKK